MAVVFILVNAFVHTVMYFYYFMSGLHFRFPAFVPLSITILQITQMFIGIGTNLFWAYMFLNGRPYVPPLAFFLALSQNTHTNSAIANDSPLVGALARPLTC